jgi:hypothetical protein
LHLIWGGKWGDYTWPNPPAGLSWAPNSQRREKNGWKIKYYDGAVRGINYEDRQSCRKADGENREKDRGVPENPR